MAMMATGRESRMLNTGGRNPSLKEYSYTPHILGLFLSKSLKKKEKVVKIDYKIT